MFNELRDIESGLASDFCGIGELYYSASVGRIADKYDGVLYKLDHMDTNLATKLKELIF